MNTTHQVVKDSMEFRLLRFFVQVRHHHCDTISSHLLAPFPKPLKLNRILLFSPSRLFHFHGYLERRKRQSKNRDVISSLTTRLSPNPQPKCPRNKLQG